MLSLFFIVILYSIDPPGAALPLVGLTVIVGSLRVQAGGGGGLVSNLISTVAFSLFRDTSLNDTFLVGSKKYLSD